MPAPITFSRCVARVPEIAMGPPSTIGWRSIWTRLSPCRGCISGCWRGGRDQDTARRELAQASVLLKCEDASRLLLFGGGFNRDALIALCGSALRDCRGDP